MKIFILIAIIILTSSTVFAATKIKNIEVIGSSAIVYAGADEVRIYTVEYPTTTCYVSYLFTQSYNMKSVQHNLDCVNK